MKFFKLHSKSISISYKNSICSFAFLYVFTSTLASVLIPIVFVSLLSPYSGISEDRILYEQPKLQFQFKHIFVGQIINGNIIACSSFAYFNQLTEDYQKCRKIKYWQNDFNHDFKIDQVNFELDIDTNSNETLQLEILYLILFFDATLKHKCILKPPAVVIQEVNVPNGILPSGEITIKGILHLIQKKEFICPFYGRNRKTYFHNSIITENSTKLTAESFLLQNIREQIQSNPAYFELRDQNYYYKKILKNENGLRISLNFDIIEIGGRYRLSIWEKLGQFWLYFASFFGISFFIHNKLKDYLFSNYILRSWEVIPWKKFY